jgi:hypothetical protein
VLGVLLAGCRGPRPVVEHVDHAVVGDGRARVTVTLRNDGGGDGQVSLTVTLRDRSGAVVGRVERPVDLHPRERIRLSLELPVAAERPGELVAEAEARYPPG